MATTTTKRTTTKKSDKAEVEKTIIQANREVRQIGRTPIERHDPNPLKLAEVRTEAYYNICERYAQKPTWEGLALAFGIDRHMLTKWKEHQVNWVSDCGIAEFLGKEWTFMNAVHVAAMESGTMDKITGIFLARNNFNYINEDPKQPRTEINVHFTADQLIEEAKNLQIVDTQKQKIIDADYEEVKEEPTQKSEPTSVDDLDLDLDLDFDDPDELILE